MGYYPTRPKEHVFFLHVLGDLAATSRGSIGLLFMLRNGTVEVLLEDGLHFVDLELGLEGIGIGRQAAAVGAATCVGKVEAIEDYFIASFTPIAFAGTVLLDLLGVLVGEAMLSKVLGDMFLRQSSALSNAGVVLGVVLVRASHLDECVIWALMERSLGRVLFVCSMDLGMR